MVRAMLCFWEDRGETKGMIIVINFYAVDAVWPRGTYVVLVYDESCIFQNERRICPHSDLPWSQNLLLWQSCHIVGVCGCVVVRVWARWYHGSRYGVGPMAQKTDQGQSCTLWWRHVLRRAASWWKIFCDLDYSADVGMTRPGWISLRLQHTTSTSFEALSF